MIVLHNIKIIILLVGYAFVALYFLQHNNVQFNTSTKCPKSFTTLNTSTKCPKSFTPLLSNTTRTKIPASSPNITLVFTVRNRIGYVQLLSESFRFLHIHKFANTYIFNDNSSAYTSEYLHLLFPHAQIINTNNKHPDVSTRQSFEWFVINTNDSTLVTIDSDTLLHPNWHRWISNWLPKSDGVLSLYHSKAPYHKTLSCFDDVCIKKTQGAMGMVFTRTIVINILKHVNSGTKKSPSSFDWGFVKYFNNQKIRIIVPQYSLALHYGMHGAHGSGNHIETSHRFDSSLFPKNIIAQSEYFLHNSSPDIIIALPLF